MSARAEVVNPFDAVRQSILDHGRTEAMRAAGWQPVYTASSTSRIAVIGQAPGRKTQESGVPWDDASGKNLMGWLGVSEDQFRDPALFTLLPMDFFFPGTRAEKRGDLPPRTGFAELWHPKFLALMPNIQLTLIIGRYAQTHYLPEARRQTLTSIVRNYKEYLPDRFPLVHPSPLNFRWQANNPWFVSDVLPVLREHVRAALA
ncbi:MAG: uracil-DNA glycosylase family protein [Microbacteriaceae bacterium]